jgi:hypothetical protein
MDAYNSGRGDESRAFDHTMGYVNVLGTTYSDRLDLYIFTRNFEGIYLARKTRVLILYT